MRAYLLFGQYLRKESLISDDDVVKARMYQIECNRLIGDRFIAKGWLSEFDVQKILIVQEESMNRFGEIAVKLGLLTPEQISEVVSESGQEYIHLGEALVIIGAIGKDAKDDKLKEFESLCKSDDPKVSKITLF
ncbi:MAG TPA: hypothetical protein ENI12_04250 [Nitrospirae bacterium]|nr:hypothetical protein [Nitrospirota bacterium]